jgi:hypothetical protein
MSSKPLFACVLCGEDFTRNSSAKRHRKIVHYSPVVRYNEYIAGRASGTYPKPIAPARMSRKSKFVRLEGEDMLKHYPSFITADSSADDILCANTDINNSIGNNSGGVSGKKVEVIDEAINDARRIVEFKDLCARLSSYTQPLIQNVMPFERFQFNDTLENILSLTIATSRQPFGFRIYNCDRCLESPIVPVFYPDMGQGTNQFMHKCRPERLSEIEGMLDKRKRVLPLRDYPIQCLQ